MAHVLTELGADAAAVIIYRTFPGDEENGRTNRMKCERSQAVKYLPSDLRLCAERRIVAAAKRMDKKWAKPTADKIPKKDPKRDEKKVPPPFVPSVTGPMDIGNIDEKYTLGLPAIDSPVSSPHALSPSKSALFSGFSYDGSPGRFSLLASDSPSEFRLDGLPGDDSSDGDADIGDTIEPIVFERQPLQRSGAFGPCLGRPSPLARAACALPPRPRTSMAELCDASFRSKAAMIRGR